MKILGKADKNVVEWLEKMKNILPPYLYDSIIMMEDNHYTGDKTAPVGFTAIMKPDEIIPELITSDIGCGVTKFTMLHNNIDLKAIDDVLIDIYRGNNKTINMYRKIWNNYMSKFKDNKLFSHFGTLGGGNHFLEIGKSNDEKFKHTALFIHSGSRGFGGAVYNYYIEKRNSYYKDLKNQKRELILKYSVKQNIQAELELLNKDIPDDFSYLPLPTSLSEEFIKDMELAILFASENRRVIAEEILKTTGNLRYSSNSAETIHNYYDGKYVRKGAIDSRENIVLIPLNIKEGIWEAYPYFIDYKHNDSLMHGLGRNCSRKEFLKTADLEQYQNETDHIVSMTINQGTLDESPSAYKKVEDVLMVNSELKKRIKFDENNELTVTSGYLFKPFYSFKENDTFIDEINKGTIKKWTELVDNSDENDIIEWD